jgi:small subunit ribosomal protein S5
MFKQMRTPKRFDANFKDRVADPFDDRVVQINRVSKKTKGGNKIGFSVIVVSGNFNGRVGVGLGKASDVAGAIGKASRRARNNLIDVPITKWGSIPSDVLVKKGAAKVLLRPAPVGSGIIAGGPVRSVVELAGIKNISSKILGTSNQASNVYATLAGLKQLKAYDVASRELRGKSGESTTTISKSKDKESKVED